MSTSILLAEALGYKKELSNRVKKVDASTITREFDFYNANLIKLEGAIQRANWENKFVVNNQVWNNYSNKDSKDYFDNTISEGLLRRKEVSVKVDRLESLLNDENAHSTETNYYKKILRLLDTAIKQYNWTVKLEGPDDIMDDCPKLES